VAYRRRFFEQLDPFSTDSARVVLPLIVPLLSPRSAIDLGCGTGGWLEVLREFGIEDVLGVDGDYVDRDQLRIPVERFMPANLALPLGLDRRFDLVICIEVGEHLPATSAATLVQTITELGTVVLFSAAIPFQGGVGHVNEQWPDYWRDLFAAQGFLLIDWLRRKVWDHPQVQPFVAQNLFLYATEEGLAQHPALRGESGSTTGLPLRLVHPGVFQVPSVGRLLHLWRQRRKIKASSTR
jgi:SAM-dependent methyltransferase